MTSVSARVRHTAHMVAQAAQYVRINTAKLEGYGATLLSGKPLVLNMDQDNAFDADIHFVDRRDHVKTASYFLMLNTMNFGSGYFKDMQAAGIPFEYAYFAKKLKNAFLSGKLDTPDKWMAASAADMHEIFDVPQGVSVHADKLMADFAECLRATGHCVVRDYNGNMDEMLKDAGRSAVRLVDIVSTWPSFKGGFDYNGAEVFLFKRAQILAADLYLALGIFDDTHELTAFADNMIPHVLRHDGILEYAPFLAEKVDSGTLIQAGSPEEIELLCCAVHAVELIKHDLHRQGLDYISSMNIDHLLWHRGYQAEIYELPTHQTKSIWY